MCNGHAVKEIHFVCSIISDDLIAKVVRVVASSKGNTDMKFCVSLIALRS
jgi:hypothetical protein